MDTQNRRLWDPIGFHLFFLTVDLTFGPKFLIAFFFFFSLKKMPLEEPPRIKSLLVAGTSVACLLTLYILSNSSTQTRDLFQDDPKENNLCTSETFNTGQWVHQSIGLESHSIEGLSSFAGYHCNWDFAHRCYMRSDHISEFNRSKAM